MFECLSPIAVTCSFVSQGSSISMLPCLPKHHWRSPRRPFCVEVFLFFFPVHSVPYDVVMTCMGIFPFLLMFILNCVNYTALAFDCNLKTLPLIKAKICCRQYVALFPNSSICFECCSITTIICLLTLISSAYKFGTKSRLRETETQNRTV